MGRFGLRLSGGTIFGQRSAFYLTAALIVACLLLGGGTRVGFLSDALLELFALPCIAVLLWRVRDAHLSLSARVLVWGSFALISWPLLQLIPLPPSLWVALPGRDQVLTSLHLLGTDLPWRPVSLAPEQSGLTILSLLAPFGVLLGTLQLSLRERRHLSVILLVVGMVSVAIGLLQVAQGPSSPLRFFDFTNPTEAVGFFRQSQSLRSFALLPDAHRCGLDAGVFKGHRCRPHRGRSFSRPAP